MVLQKLQDQSKALEQTYRTIWSHLARIHALPATDLEAKILLPLGPMFTQVRVQVNELMALVPEHRYYQWNQTFSFVLKQLSSAAVLAYFLGTGKLLHLDGVMRSLGISLQNEDRVLLPAEDYLVSLTYVTNELSRLAYTSVTVGDLGTPLVISHFIKDLYAGFQLLNLKNNELRRRFDSIKVSFWAHPYSRSLCLTYLLVFFLFHHQYDVKKIEEVVYDLYLRGLVPREPSATPPPGLSFTTNPEEASQNDTRVGALIGAK